MLIKLAQKNLDRTILQKKMKTLEMEELSNQVKLIEEATELEYKKFFDTIYAQSLEKYIHHSNAKKSELYSIINNIKTDLTSLEEEIGGYYQELKRFEILDANIQKKLHAETLRSEMKEQDYMVRLKF